MKLRSLCPSVLVCLLLGWTNHHADGAQITVGQDCMFVRLSGEIDRHTPALLLEALEGHSCKNEPERTFGFFLYLDSLGGDVDAAMAVGRIARKWRANAWVDDGAICASACVVALLGGVTRDVIGTIGLHRPYATEMSVSTEKAETNYRSMTANLQNYFREMNIPPRLLDTMNATGPQKIRWLSGKVDEKELEDLWIEGTDPIFEDVFLSHTAADLNISKQELITRLQRARLQCGVIGGPSNTYDFRTARRCWEQIRKTGHYP